VLRRGGCYLTRDASLCTAPCPEPAAPALPEPPRPPQYLPCPTGWIDDAEAHALSGVCRPAAERRARTFRLPGGECRAPGSPCADEWAAGLDEPRTTFVRAGAVGGDGTRARPLGSLAEAWALGAPTIALAAGAHALVGELSGPRRVVGARSEQSVVGAQRRDARRRRGVEDLTLRAPALVVQDATLRAVHQLGEVRVLGSLVFQHGVISSAGEAVRRRAARHRVDRRLAPQRLARLAERRGQRLGVGRALVAVGDGHDHRHADTAP
jgi:hypothetical protein